MPKPDIKPAPKKALFELGPNCRSWLTKFKSWHKPRAAFAVGADGSCGWSYGFRNLSAATARALAECHKHNSNCKIILTR